MRTAEVQRNTKETQIRVRLNLDGKGVVKLATGIPFLEHMLDQVARHGMVDLDIEDRWKRGHPELAKLIVTRLEPHIGKPQPAPTAK